MKKVIYYTKRFGYNALPRCYFKKKYKKLVEYEQTIDPAIVNQRVNYYANLVGEYDLPGQAIAIKDFKRPKKFSSYYLDLKEYTHYFNSHIRFGYQFGDGLDIPSHPTFFKARLIGEQSKTSILFKLNKHRHFQFTTDSKPFKEKKNKAVWRGQTFNPDRKRLVKLFWNHPLCDVGQSKPMEDVVWMKPFLSKEEQLQYKFIFCPEGNDVATSLKWVLSSNSLCLMSKPERESWFMEGALQAGIHFVEVRKDYADVEEKMEYYSKHVEEAEQIIQNANEYCKPFKNNQLEDLVCIRVFEMYAQLTGQEDCLRF